MPRFHFTIRYLSVTEGLGQLDLPNLAAAHYEALKIVQAYRAKMAAERLDPRSSVVEISDQSHCVVLVVPF